MTMDNDMMMMMVLMLAMPQGRNKSAPVEAWISSSDYVPAPGRMLWSLKNGDDHERAVDQTQLRVGTQVVGLVADKKLSRADLDKYPDLQAAYDRIAPATNTANSTVAASTSSLVRPANC